MHQATQAKENSSDSVIDIKIKTTSTGADTTDANFAKLLKDYLPNFFIAADSFESGVKVIYTKTLNRISALLFGISVLMLAFVCLYLDFLYDNFDLGIPLLLFCVPIVFSLLWLINKNHEPLVSLGILGSSVTLLFIYLLTSDGPSDGSTMVWIAVFPIAMLLALGLRFGTYVFIIIYIFMLLLFKTSFGSIVSVPLADTMETRLLIVCLGGFCFTWCYEFARYKTSLALLVAAYRIEQNSFTDALTGLGNRRDFDRSLAWTMARVKRKTLPFALAIIDIDHFKKVNDTHGHAVGDEVLKFIANEVEKQIRNADRIFRWGGEEFAIIMPSTDLEMALIGAERVRKHIENTPVVLDNVTINITISIGVYAGAEGNDPTQPLQIADACLYKAKATGRNRVVGVAQEGFTSVDIHS